MITARLLRRFADTARGMIPYSVTMANAMRLVKVRTCDAECRDTEAKDHERQNQEVERHGYRKGDRVPGRITQHIDRTFS